MQPVGEVDAHGPRQLIRRAALGALACLTVVACGGPTSRNEPRSAQDGSAHGVTDKPHAVKEALPFVDDDYPRALAEAKRTKRPLFVDAWAPWCHSCQSMRAFVLTDPSLAPLANDFVWLAIDTEKDANAPFVEKFGNRVWPTLWVIDAEHETTTLRWEGTATAPELLTLLGTVRAGARPDAAESTAAFLRASQAAARGDVTEAEKGYRALLDKPGFAERPRAVEALLGLLSSSKKVGPCAELALAETATMAPGTSRATSIAIGLACARDAKNTAATSALAELALRVATDRDPRTIADDRSALFEELVETKKEQGDAAGAKATAEAWASFLEGEAARAPSKQARAVFDPHRLAAYLAAGQPERAVPMLRESEHDFPDDYNPPARLARAYLTAGRLDEAKAAVERASARVYGPRSLRVLVLAADIAKARGDAPGERSALEQALARTAHVVLNENQKKLRADLEKRLRQLPR